MSHLNFAIPEFSLTVGGVEFAPFVTSLSLSRPRVETSTAQSWTGGITFQQPLNATALPESLSEFDNPTRWGKGLHPVVIKFRGQVCCVVRVLEYVFNDDFSADYGIGEARVGDLLTLLDYKTPATDYKGLGFSPAGGVSINALAKAVLAEVGAAGDIDVPGDLWAAPDKPNGSFLKWLQSYCGERGYWLYVDTNEQIRAVKYPQAPAAAQINCPRDQVENFSRRRGIEPPKEKLKVTGSCQKPVQCSHEEAQVEIDYAVLNGAQVIQRRQTTSAQPPIFNQQTTYITIEQALGLAMPDSYPNSATPIVVADSVRRANADDQGRIKKIVTSTRKPLGVAIPDQFPGNTVSRDAERLTEEFSHSPADGATSAQAGVMRSRKSTLETLMPDGNALSFAIKEQTIESWSGAPPNPGSENPPCQRYVYTKVVYRRQNDAASSKDSAASQVTSKYPPLGALIIVQNERQDDATPPSFSTLPPANPVGTVVLKGEAKAKHSAYNPYVEQEDEIQASTIQSNAEAANLAEWHQAFRHSDFYGRDINLPVSPDWLANPAPFAIGRIHNGVFVLTNDTISLSADELEIAWQGMYLGAIPPLASPTDPWAAPVSPIQIVQAALLTIPYQVGTQQLDVFTNTNSETVNALVIYPYRVNYRAGNLLTIPYQINSPTLISTLLTIPYQINSPAITVTSVLYPYNVRTNAPIASGVLFILYQVNSPIQRAVLTVPYQVN
jgi:hypothetical protein